MRTSRASRLLLTLVLALATLVVPAVLATSQAQASTCKSTDKFTGSVARMEHFLRCNHVPFEVHTMPNPATRAAAIALPSVARDLRGGGPRCSWQTKHIVQICLSKDGPGASTWHRHLICAQYWAGSYYPYHCGPAQAYNLTHAEGLWSVVKRVFKSRAARACVRGTIGGGATAVILKTAGAATGVGVMATLAGGCVGGIVTFFWHI